jgi:Fic family protein
MQVWRPIESLPENWREMAHDELGALASVWQEQQELLENTQSYRKFLDKMRRKIAIETGVIERLYTIDRGTTQLLIEHGIDEAIIQHGTTDKPVAQVVALIRDQEKAIEGIFDFVASQRDLSNSYIKQLHQFLTRHQEYTEAQDQFGNIGKVPLLRGGWKKQPNNPQRNGEIFYYCPPEQVDSEMDRLINWYLDYQNQQVNPDVLAAWLHHRFTQIHPFQDGNGRVARVLASLVFIRAKWFPLVITRDDRTDYIIALEKADEHNLQPLVSLFAKAQKQAFLGSLSLSEEILAEGETFQAILDAAVQKIKKKHETSLLEAKKNVQQHADSLFNLAKNRFTIVVEELNTALKSVTPHAKIYTKVASFV